MVYSIVSPSIQEKSFRSFLFFSRNCRSLIGVSCHHCSFMLMLFMSIYFSVCVLYCLYRSFSSYCMPVCVISYPKSLHLTSLSVHHPLIICKLFSPTSESIFVFFISSDERDSSVLLPVALSAYTCSQTSVSAVNCCTPESPCASLSI